MVKLAREANASWKIRKTVIVDLDKLDAKSYSRSYEEILAFKPLCKIADCSQLNGDLSRKLK